METQRINSIDIVRGIVMLIMPLDHICDLLHIDSLTQSPTDLSTTTPLLFFSRWITHFCAPIFVFLAGTSAQRFLAKQQNISVAKNYLLKRGTYLIILEFLVVNFLIYFDPAFHNQLFEVIAAIGFGFICLAIMLRLDQKIITLLGLFIVFLHGLFPLIPFGEQTLLKSILSPLFGPSAVPLTDDRILIIAYAPLPWLGIMLLGFATGSLYELEQSLRLKKLLRLGAVSILLFFVFRVMNSYGDPSKWSTQANEVYTVLSFLNVSKYPPSLLFCLMTLGLMLLALAYFEKTRNRVSDFALVFGRVPLFFFLLHFLAIHLLLIAVLLFQGFSWQELSFSSGNFGRPKNVPSGVTLAYVLLIWPILIIALYPICKWFGSIKQRNKSWWVSYL